MEKQTIINTEYDGHVSNYDLKRMAEMMYKDSDFYDYVSKYTDEYSNELNDLASFDLGMCCMAPSFGITDTITSLLSSIRKVFKKKDPESLNTVHSQLMMQPKEDIVMALIETLSKISPDKQKEILEHIYGNRSASDQRVAIEVIKRGKEQKYNKDKYMYYVCFTNIKTNAKRIVTFANHASASIYVMYLIDRVVRKDKSKPIDILKNTNLLQDINDILFEDDGELKGLRPTLHTDSQGNYHKDKVRLSQYYKDICKVVSDNLHEWDFVQPYRCDSSTPIKVHPDLITIPSELIPEEWNIQE